MLAKIYTATLIGLEAKIIEVEVDIFHGERKISIVGLPDKAVKESKERIMSAFKNTGILLGAGNKIVNLAPADIPKIGPAYDFPIAVGLLVAGGVVQKFRPQKKIFIGELALNGTLRPVRGIVALIESLRAQGYTEIYLPNRNELEASLVRGINVYPIRNLQNAINLLQGKETFIQERSHAIRNKTKRVHYDFDFKHIKGQYKAKRALEIAAAGGHNILLSGTPGSGKSLLAKSFPSILPKLSYKESLEVTRLYSIAGQLNDEEVIVSQRPFRNPHHSSSLSSIIGGGIIPKPGEISLAHCGVLFLDEFTEFDSQVIESMRQPLEDNFVTVSRINSTVRFPCNFQLVAAMNPCKCGYYGDPEKECTCTEYDRNAYKRRISGPILDRIDLFVNVSRIKRDLLMDPSLSESSSEIRKRVTTARKIQELRFTRFVKENSSIYTNSDMTQEILYRTMELEDDAKTVLRRAIRSFCLSARSYYKVLKVARTIADLSGVADIHKEHITEALSYRSEMQI